MMNKEVSSSSSGEIPWKNRRSSCVDGDADADSEDEGMEGGCVPAHQPVLTREYYRINQQQQHQQYLLLPSNSERSLRMVRTDLEGRDFKGRGKVTPVPHTTNCSNSGIPATPSPQQQHQQKYLRIYPAHPLISVVRAATGTVNDTVSVESTIPSINSTSQAKRKKERHIANARVGNNKRRHAQPDSTDVERPTTRRRTTGSTHTQPTTPIITNPNTPYEPKIPTPTTTTNSTSSVAPLFNLTSPPTCTPNGTHGTHGNVTTTTTPTTTTNVTSIPFSQRPNRGHRQQSCHYRLETRRIRWENFWTRSCNGFLSDARTVGRCTGDIREKRVTTTGTHYHQEHQGTPWDVTFEADINVFTPLEGIQCDN
eukprot:NODE_137_length_1387_cov_465.405556_g133_i0.p1 GENE.NODE_137_length_1387_cov_465.405556_g133_i0~~NODE_137_length_1387_cov_465.405556_g133_i0.p1  ORF type:complete len:368 (-),score=98.54 NODE_137_length_1387_cov_465.405556_g133_i0:199-1302(-)